MPRSKSRAIVRSSVRSARSRWATPGRVERRRHQAVVERRRRAVAEVEPSASCSGPTTWAATNTTASATSGAVSGSPSVTAAISHPDATAISAGSDAAHDEPDPPRRGVPGRGAAEGAEERPLLAPAQPVRSPGPRRRTGRRWSPCPHHRPRVRAGLVRMGAHRRHRRSPSCPTPLFRRPTARVAVVTGANHGIGAATAVALAGAGVDVLVTYLRLDDRRTTPARPDAYRRQRAATADDVLAAIEPLPGRAVAVEADLTDDGAAGPALRRGRGRARARCRSSSTTPAAGVADTFAPDATDRLGRRLAAVTPATIDRNLGVDARAGALLIAELARRHVARGATWGRIVGLTSGGPTGFPQRGVLRRGQGGARELHDVGGRPSWPRSASRPTSSTRRSPTPAGSPTRSGPSSPRRPTTTTSPRRPRWPRSSPGCAPTPPGSSPGARSRLR